MNPDSKFIKVFLNSTDYTKLNYSNTHIFELYKDLSKKYEIKYTTEWLQRERKKERDKKERKVSK